MLITIDKNPLIQYLLQKNLSIKDFAMQADVSSTVIRNILSGRKIRITSAGKIFKLIPALVTDILS